MISALKATVQKINTGAAPPHPEGRWVCGTCPCDCSLRVCCAIPGQPLNFKASSLCFYVIFSFCKSTDVGACPHTLRCLFCASQESGPFPRRHSPRPSLEAWKTPLSHLPDICSLLLSRDTRSLGAPRLRLVHSCTPAIAGFLVLKGLSLLPRGLLRAKASLGESPGAPCSLLPRARGQWVPLVAPLRATRPPSILRVLTAPSSPPAPARMVSPALWFHHFLPACPCPHLMHSSLSRAEIWVGNVNLTILLPCARPSLPLNLELSTGFFLCDLDPQAPFPWNSALRSPPRLGLLCPVYRHGHHPSPTPDSLCRGHSL